MKISETKCRCYACGNVWYYGKQELARGKAAKDIEMGKALLCFSGCLPAILIPNVKAEDPRKCPKCGSQAFSKTQVTHNV